jgi:hypothetical protein
MEKYEVRVLLTHCWKQNYKAAAETKKSDVEGEGAVNERNGEAVVKTVCEWQFKFS